MVRFSFAAALLFAAGACFAQMTPVGSWHSFDEKTKELKSEIQIIDSQGVLSAKVTKLLRKEAKQDAICEECSDDRKGKPMLGLEIIRVATKTEGKDIWEGGKILDPENGKSYTLKLTPIEGGAKLEVRGSFGPFGRTQVWVRVSQ